MFIRLRHLMAVSACGLITAAGLVTGVFASCDGHYCQTDIMGCTPLNQPYQASCCRPSSNGSQCYTCWRDDYWCAAGVMAGPAYNCSGAGAICS